METKNVMGKWMQQIHAKKLSVMCMAIVLCTAFASAEDASTVTITSAFQTGFTTMASDALSMIAIIIPIALGVAGAVFLSRKALGWFKSLAK